MGYSAHSNALGHSLAVMAALFGPVDARSFGIRYWDGTTEQAHGDATPFTLVVNRPGALRRMLLPPSELSIAEAYLSGDLAVEGDLEAAVTLGDSIRARVSSPRVLAGITRHLLALPSVDHSADVVAARSGHTVPQAGRKHAKERDRAAIHYHYDVGNDFYSLWLDQRLVYSCAYFRSSADTLEDAQLAKLDLVCRKLRLAPGDRLLDVGCGWGALVMHAAARYGVTALGITLSESQASLARRRIQAAGLGDRCRIELRDYRELGPSPAFDKISSVGMVEHVGQDHLAEYFASLHRALVPGGLLLNHGIVNASARPQGFKARLARRLWKSDAFIDQYVFPDGRLVPLAAVVGAAESAGFETRDMESLRPHYALTLHEWLRRLVANADRATALTSDRTFRTWRLYMTASAHGFATGELNVVQTLFAKLGPDGCVGLGLRRAV